MPRTVLFVGLLAVLLAAPAAQAQSTRSKILRECQDGALRGDYTISEIRDARNNIPDDIDQYSDCRDVLARALAARAGGSGDGDSGGGGGAGGGGGGGGGGVTLTPATDDDRRALEEAAAGGNAPVEVGGRKIVPGTAATDTARNDMPSTLIAVLVLLAAAAAIAAAPFVRRHALAPLGPQIRRRLPGR
jgi:hypothetical protein